MHCSKHIENIFSRFDFPQYATDVIKALFKRLDDEKEFGKEFDQVVKMYMYPEPHDVKQVEETLNKISETYNANIYTLDYIFLLTCSEILYERYIERGLSEELYWETMYDLRCKLNEGIDWDNQIGTTRLLWYDTFFKMTKFAFGRFQYVTHRIPVDYTTKNGHVLKQGDPCYAIHIPYSKVSLTDEVRIDSYKKAYQFYKEHNGLKDGLAVFHCSSWLLYPINREILPETSNILRFMDDFEIYGSMELEYEVNGRRIWGKQYNLPYAELPEDSSLKRAYKGLLLSGRSMGSGQGIIIFDGEKIIT